MGMESDTLTGGPGVRRAEKPDAQLQPQARMMRDPDGWEEQRDQPRTRKAERPAQRGMRRHGVHRPIKQCWPRDDTADMASSGATELVLFGPTKTISMRLLLGGHVLSLLEASSSATAHCGVSAAGCQPMAADGMG